MDGRTDVQMDIRTDNLPILQDFVPYWGHYPIAAKFQLEYRIMRDKGTVDRKKKIKKRF